MQFIQYKKMNKFKILYGKCDLLNEFGSSLEPI